NHEGEVENWLTDQDQESELQANPQASMHTPQNRGVFLFVVTEGEIVNTIYEYVQNITFMIYLSKK
ncbi:hypothetical protein, partial [Tumebacillus permanentifrigoris]